MDRLDGTEVSALAGAECDDNVEMGWDEAVVLVPEPAGAADSSSGIDIPREDAMVSVVGSGSESWSSDEKCAMKGRESSRHWKKYSRKEYSKQDQCAAQRSIGKVITVLGIQEMYGWIVLMRLLLFLLLLGA